MIFASLGILSATAIFLLLAFLKEKKIGRKNLKELEVKNQQVQSLTLQLAESEAQRLATQKTLENSQEHFSQLQKEMKESFSGLAAKALEGNNRQFMDLAKSIFEKEHQSNKHTLDKKYSEFENLVKPLNEAVNSYYKQSQELSKERERSFALIEGELKKVVEANLSLSQTTTALKDALKKPHVRGRWGEVQLKNCIELAGMSEYCDVTFQDTHADEDQILRPDMTVKMPGGRVVVVDAKTPLDAFISSLEAKDEKTREAEIIRHGKHLKEHVRKLSTKDYANFIENSADFTILFLPNESFLYAALEAQGDLVEFAIERKILIATPPTFIGLLKVIRFGWNEERLAENAQKISEAGKELHKRIADFFEAYSGIGKAIEKAQQEYSKGLSRLNSRVLVQAKRLEELGAKGKKELPKIASQLEEPELTSNTDEKSEKKTNVASDIDATSEVKAELSLEAPPSSSI